MDSALTADFIRALSRTLQKKKKLVVMFNRRLGLTRERPDAPGDQIQPIRLQIGARRAPCRAADTARRVFAAPQHHFVKHTLGKIRPVNTIYLFFLVLVALSLKASLLSLVAFSSMPTHAGVLPPMREREEKNIAGSRLQLVCAQQAFC